MDFLVNIFGLEITNWIIIPILIAVSRILDVSLDTLKVVFVSQGFKKLSVVFNFLGTLVWIIVVRQVITNLENPLWLVAYAIGASTGTYIGLIISEKLAVGRVAIRTNIRNNPERLIGKLRKKGFGVTVIQAHGKIKPSKMIYSVIEAKQIEKYVGLIKKNNPKAFYSIEQIKSVNQGIFKAEKNNSKLSLFMRNIVSYRR